MEVRLNRTSSIFSVVSVVFHERKIFFRCQSLFFGQLGVCTRLLPSIGTCQPEIQRLATQTSTIDNQPCNSVQFSRRLRQTSIIKLLVRRSCLGRFSARDPRCNNNDFHNDPVQRTRVYNRRKNRLPLVYEAAVSRVRKFVDLNGPSNKSARKKTFCDTLGYRRLVTSQGKRERDVLGTARRSRDN